MHGVGVPGLIHALDEVVHFVLVDFQDINAVFPPHLVGGVDKDAEVVGVVAQDIVGAAAHKDTGLLAGELLNHTLLNLEEPVLFLGGGLAQGVLHLAVAVRRGQLVADLGVAEGELGFFQHLFQHVPVVVVHAQQFRHLDGDGAAQAAELAGDGDHVVVQADVELLGLQETGVKLAGDKALVPHNGHVECVVLMSRVEK